MQILLLATGESDKLRPLTDTLPAPMLPVANRPVMAYAIEMLARQGIKKITVSLYHMGNSIEAYFGDGRRWGIEIEYVLQRDAWGSAGTIKWAERALSETFMVLPADILIDLDIESVLAQHRAKGSAATVVLHKSGSGNASHLDGDGSLLLEEPSTAVQPLFPTGIAIFETHLLEMIPARTAFDQEELWSLLAQEEILVHGYQADSYYNPLASFLDYQTAQHDSLSYLDTDGHVLDSTTRTLEARQMAEGIWVGRNHVIHPSVGLAQPVYIGDNCQIGRNVELGPNVVLGTNVVIDDEATVSQSVVLDYTYIGKLVNIDNRVVNRNMMIDVGTGERLEIVDEFLLGEAHPTLIGSWLRRTWDTIVSLFLLILTLPITLPAALLSWLTTGRMIARHPYLGEQRGIVADDAELNTFIMYRLNTHNSDGELAGFGRWLEKTDLYRLPELWNVFKGDMSMVGVKPLQPDEAAKLVEAWQQQRYQHPAGFTGLWYIQTRQSSELDEILMADAYYVATRTRRGDIKLFWQTPSSWFRRLRE